MSLFDDLNAAMKDAMRARDTITLDTLRMAKAAFKNKEIEKMKPLAESEQMAILQTLIKQRLESAEQFRKGGREELAAKEESEIAVLKKFLPTALSDDELNAIVKEAIASLGASDMKLMGAVIKEVMAKTAGRADGGRISTAVKTLLTAK